MNILFLLQPKADTIYINNNSSIRQCLEKMKAHGYSTIPVINDEGTYCGIISHGDLLWHIVEDNSFELKEQEQICINDIMKKFEYQTIRIDGNLDELIEIISNQHFVPVVDDRNLYVGIITIKDIINYLYKNSDDYNLSKYLYK